MTLVMTDADGRTYVHQVNCPPCPIRMAEIVEVATLEHQLASLMCDKTIVAKCERNGRPWLKLPGANQ